MNKQEKAFYDYAVSQGITGQELIALMAQTNHESTGFSRLKEGSYSLNNMENMGSAKTARLKAAGLLDASGVRTDLAKTYNTDGNLSKNIFNAIYGPLNGNLGGQDGSTYKGRGYIQLTGRDNYQLIGDDIGVDLINNPDLMLDPDIARQATLAWWKRNVSSNANRDWTDTEAVTRTVNGGTNGLTDRENQVTHYSEILAPGYISRDNINEYQTELTKQGYDTQGADGQVGPNTIAATKAFQTANGMEATGTFDTATRGLLDPKTNDGVMLEPGGTLIHTPPATVPTAPVPASTPAAVPAVVAAPVSGAVETAVRLVPRGGFTPSDIPPEVMDVAPLQFNEGTPNVPSALQSPTPYQTPVPMSPAMPQDTAFGRDLTYEEIMAQLAGYPVEPLAGRGNPATQVQPAVPPQGDMQGYPEGVLGLSGEQMLQAVDESFADPTAFDPRVPPVETVTSAAPAASVIEMTWEGPVYIPADKLLSEMDNDRLQMLSSGRSNAAPYAAAELVKRGQAPISVQQAPLVPQAGVVPTNEESALMLGMNQVPQAGTALAQEEKQYELQELNRKLDELNKQIVFMESGSQGRAVLQTQIDQVKGKILSYGVTPEGTIPDARQTGFNAGLAGAQHDLNTAERNLASAGTPDQIVAASAGIKEAQTAIDENQTIPEVTPSAVTTGNQDTVAARTADIAELNKQISEASDPWLIQALEEKRAMATAGLNAAQTALNDENRGAAGEPVVPSIPEVSTAPSALPEVPTPGSTTGTALLPGGDLTPTGPATDYSTLTDAALKELAGTGDVGAIDAMTDKAAGAIAEVPEDVQTKAAGLLKDFFGLEGADIKRALGLYLMSRLSGASHEGSMRWAGGTVLKAAATRDAAGVTSAAKTAEENKTIRALVAAGYTEASARSYVQTGLKDVLSKTEGSSAGIPTGATNRIQVVGVAGFADQTIYQQTFKQPDDSEVETVRFKDPDTGEYTTVRMQEFENIIRQSGGSINTTPLTRQDRAEAITTFVKDLAPALESKLSEENKGLLGNWTSGLTKYWQEQGYDMTDPRVVSTLSSLAYQAADRANGIMATTGKRVTDLSPLVLSMQLEASSMQANDSIWTTKAGRVSQDKIAEVNQVLFNESGGNLKEVGGAFTAYLTEFNALPQSETNAMRPGENENKFYIYLRKQLGL